MSVVIDGTTGISGISGSASTPALQGEDSNTGMFFPAADTVAVATAGTERMRIDSSGNVGIGTSSPLAELHVNSGAANLVGLFESTDAGAILTLIDDATTGGSAAQHGLNTVGNELEVRAVETLAFETAATERLRITSSGNVGIGTVSPAVPLQVNGLVRLETASPTLQLSETDTTDQNFSFRLNAGAMIFEQRNNDFSTQIERMRITSAGNVGIGTTSPDAALHLANATSANFILEDSGASTLTAAQGKVEFQRSNDFSFGGLYVTDGTTDLNIATKFTGGFLTFGTDTGTERMRITDTGNVGIGTETPASALDVLGSIRASTQFVSTITTGTAPFSVQSTTRVSNLNVATAGTADTATTLTGLTSTVAELNFVDGVTSNVQTQLNAKAPLASPALTGTPTAPTAAAGTNTTQLATTAFVATGLTSLNASNLSAGTVPDARLSGTYSGFTHKMDGVNTTFTTPNTGSTNTSARTVYGLAEYRSSSSAQVGAIVFIAPDTTSTIMHQFEISGLLYNQNIVNMVVQGYRTTGAWTDVRKISTGTVDVQTRWALTPDGKNCLILGDVATSWSYPHFSIVRAMFSHSGTVDGYCSGWTVAVVTDLSLYTNVTATIADSTMVGSVSGNAATATTLTGLTSTVAELNKLDGVTATTAELNFVDGVTSNIQTQFGAKANLASPALTGTPTAPTAAVTTNTTQIATTAFVNAEIANDAPTKTGGGASGTWAIAISGNAATATKLATSSGSAPAYAARAWVSHNGSGGILASGNVSSVSGSGSSFTINFSTALPTADFVVAGTTNNTGYGIAYVSARSTTAVSITWGNRGTAGGGGTWNSIVVFA